VRALPGSTNGFVGGCDGRCALVRRNVPSLALTLTALATLAVPGLTASSAAAAARAPAPGTQLWISRYSAPANDNRAFSVAVSPNGRTVYVTGTSFSGSNYGKGATGTDYRTVAYNAATGARLWAARYNGPGNNTDDPYSVAVSPDGRTVYVTGASAAAHSTSFDYATVAYRAATGARLWVARYNGPGNDDDEARSVAVSPDSRVVYVTGSSRGTTSAYDWATIAYSASTGARLWLKRYNSPANGPDHAFSLAVSPDGRSIYVTGSSSTANFTYDYATIAYNAATGVQRWVRRYNGPGNDIDISSSVAVSPDGRTVYVTGQSADAGNIYSFATIAYNAATGTVLWLRRHAGLGESLAVSPDGSTVDVTGQVYVTGQGEAFLTVAYRASDGAQLWAQPYVSPGGGSYSPFAVAVSPNGKTVYVSGLTWSAAGWADTTVALAAATGAPLWAQGCPTTHDASYGPALTVSRATGRVYMAGTILTGSNTAAYATIAYSG
jgi:DNA-binding beta-propeller fold protein YncE